VLERENLMRALKQVKRNHGAPGIDAMTVEALPAYLKAHWLALREQQVGPRAVAHQQDAGLDAGIATPYLSCHGAARVGSVR
jgi:hypothetical protein